jgi:hypothetical protein
MVKMLWDRSMLQSINLQDVFHAIGKPVFIGAFAMGSTNQGAG